MILKKVKYLLIIFIIFISSVNIIFAANLQDAFKTNDGSKKDPLDSAADKAGYDVAKTDIDPIIGTVIQTALSFLGVIFIILMIYGGYSWMTAKGNTEQVEKAKETIMAAIIGLSIVVAAYAISYFVIEKLTETTLTML